MLIIKLYHLQVRDFRSTGRGTLGSEGIKSWKHWTFS